MPEDRGLPKPAPQQRQELTVAIERGDVIVCLTKCEECQAGSHYDEPTWHGWAGAEDIKHARATGQPDPSNSRCGCYCAKTEAHLGGPDD